MLQLHCFNAASDCAAEVAGALALDPSACRELSGLFCDFTKLCALVIVDLSTATLALSSSPAWMDAIREKEAAVTTNMISFDVVFIGSVSRFRQR